MNEQEDPAFDLLRFYIPRYTASDDTVVRVLKGLWVIFRAGQELEKSSDPDVTPSIYEGRSLDEWRDVLDGTTPSPWTATVGGSITGPDGQKIGEWGNATIHDARLVTIAREAVEEVIRVTEENRRLTGDLENIRRAVLGASSDIG